MFNMILSRVTFLLDTKNHFPYPQGTKNKFLSFEIKEEAMGFLKRLREPRVAMLRFACAAIVVCALALTGCAGLPIGDAKAQSPKNIVIIFADGVAATQWDFGRYSSNVLRRQPFVTTDLFREKGIGLLISSPHGLYVTDSAAAGSAMATGFKIENGVLSVTPDGKSVRTVMQAAKAKGKHIGLISTATIYDATPAAFSMNAKSRRDSQALVDKYLSLEPDVLLGGGADFFLPAGAPGGKRKDGKNIVAAFRSKGWQVVSNTAELKAATGAKLLGLFADEDMDFEIESDRVKEPTMAEMTAGALKALSQTNPNGFVLLVENENTDTAGHANDAASLMHALWAIDDAVKVALEFQRNSPDTLVIVTGDHETGGFSPTYALKDLSSLSSSNRFYFGDTQLKMLAPITMSFTTATEKLGKKPSAEALDALVAKHFPGFKLDADLRELILKQKPLERSHAYVVQNVLGRMVARQTGIYWGTGGHTSEPVLVGAVGPGSELFRGYQDNTDFGRNLHRLIEAR
jgi:alkaline phosphatase